tara:strand:- start:2453 stop:3304 length:852 start_codon:yes stop_codon:yes gene_type:complete
MNLLISGSTGFVGKYLTEMFRSKGHDVLTLGRSEFNDYQVNLETEFIEVNNEFDIIIHCAGIVHNQLHASNFIPDLVLKDFLITTNFLKSIESTNHKKVVFLSSVAIYGLNSGLDIAEDCIPNPTSGYGVSKLLSEKLFELSINKQKLLIFRLPLVNGPNPKGNIEKLEKAISQGKMVLFRSNVSKKSLLEVSYLFDMIASNGLKLCGVFNIKSYDIVFNEFAEEIGMRTATEIFKLPYFVLRALKFISKILCFRLVYLTVLKISTHLTFDDSLLLEKIDQTD